MASESLEVVFTYLQVLIVRKSILDLVLIESLYVCVYAYVYTYGCMDGWM